MPAWDEPYTFGPRPGGFTGPGFPNYKQPVELTPGAGTDRSSAAMGFIQPQTIEPGAGRPWYMTTQAPQRLAAFEQSAYPLIEQMFGGAFRQQLSTLTGQKRHSDRISGDAYAAEGYNPAIFHGQVRPEQDLDFASLVSSLQGQAVSGRASAEMGLQGQILNAMNQIEAYYDSLGLQEYLASKARKAARSAGDQSFLGSILGGGLGAIGSYFGAGGGGGGGGGGRPTAPIF